MSDALKVLGVLLALLALAGFGVWSSFRCLRAGVFTSRGIEISRLKNPIQFWIGISIGFGVSAILGVSCIAVAWLLLTHWGA
jgi:hypothetical protein